MMVANRWLAAAVLLLTLGCNPFARRRTPAAPTVDVPPPPKPAETKPKPVNYPEPPVIAPESAGTVPGPAEDTQTNLPPPPETDTPAPTTQPAPQEQPSEPPAVPQLTQLLTEREIAIYNQEIDRNLTTVASLERTVATRRLDEQAGLALERVRALAAQAEETRGRDLATARSLAARALMLATDLESRTR